MGVQGKFFWGVRTLVHLMEGRERDACPNGWLIPVDGPLSIFSHFRSPFFVSSIVSLFFLCSFFLLLVQSYLGLMARCLFAVLYPHIVFVFAVFMVCV